MESSLRVILILFAIYPVYQVDCACTLNLNEDFGAPPPVYLRGGEYLTPDSNGAISLQRSETVQVACPGNKRRVVVGNTTTGYDLVEAHCIFYKTFRVDRWIGQFVEIHCNIQPLPVAMKTKERCHGDNHVVSVGYDIRNKFYPLYEACFDQNRLTTLYVKHQLTPASVFSQNNYGNKRFFDSLHHEKVINNAYKQQAARIDAILGPGMSKEYLTRKQYLARGHLAARTDFIMQSHQRASYQYVNSAPQWQRGNSGDWAALEAALRQHIHNYGTNVTVYTGTAGVSSLRDQAGKLQELYLAVDENNNGIMPVPLYFFKLVYDPKRRAAAAFVSINTPIPNPAAMFGSMKPGTNRTINPSNWKMSPSNPTMSPFNRTVSPFNWMMNPFNRMMRSFNRTMSPSNRTSDGCGCHVWLHWRPHDNTDSFCCDYATLAAEVPHLPRLDVQNILC